MDARNEALESIRKLSGVERITNQQRTILAIRKVILAFTQAGLNGDIDEIDDLIGDTVRSDTQIFLNLSDHYGQRIVGSPYPVEELAGQLERMQKYTKAADENGYPEKKLLWELFIEFKRNKYTSNPTTDSLVESIRDLSENDLPNFCNAVILFSDSTNWQNKETQEGRELEKLVLAIQENYQSIEEGCA